MDDWGWLGPDAWFAHCIHLDEKDVRRIADTGSGVASCPSSNLRIGAGIAPVRALVDEGARVGLGVDGPASNEPCDLFAEIRQAMLVSRAGGPSAASPPTRPHGSPRAAAPVRRGDLSALEPRRRADVALFGVDGLAHAGTDDDPVPGCSLGRRSGAAPGGGGRASSCATAASPADEDDIAREGIASAEAIARRRP
jgi:cytosine/adenosine deaminase-related metal-dependent hydrolase